jgi:hypothetical protein
MWIEIISAPSGPAPQEFREAWIGCFLFAGKIFCLPGGCVLLEEIDNIKTAKECGFIGVEPHHLPAFVVLLIPAMQQLADKSRDAVEWWEKRWQQQGREVTEEDVLLFEKRACRIVYQ